MLNRKPIHHHTKGAPMPLGSPPSSAGGFPEPPPACGCGGCHFPLPLPGSLLHALPCSAPCGRVAELGRHSRGPPSPLGSGGRGPPSPLFPLPAPEGAERCPALRAGLSLSAGAKGANLRAGRVAPAFVGVPSARCVLSGFVRARVLAPFSPAQYRVNSKS